MERFKDDLLFVGGNADARVAHRESNYLVSTVEDAVVWTPPTGDKAYTQIHPPPFGKLEGVGKQILQHLLQAFAIGVEAPRQVRCKFDVEFQPLVNRDMPEGAIHLVAQIAEEHFAGLHRHGAGLDLGQIEDVVD